MTPLPLDADLPWLRPAQAAFNAALAADRLGHALLLQASPGQGGHWLALWIAARMFCRTPVRATARDIEIGDSPCGQCLECRRVMSGEQPDLLLLQPLEDSKEIRVDQVRELSAELSLTAHGGGRKVAIIAPADRLNRNAANALLKTLEEPSGRALLLLVTGEPSRLPATVQSRCTRLSPRPADEEAQVRWLLAQRPGSSAADWRAALALLGAQPLTALAADASALAGLRRDTERALADAVKGALDVVETADRWAKDDYPLRVACIEAWITDRLRDWGRGTIASSLPAAAPQALFEALDHAREARQWAETPVNKPLALERILWRLASAGASARRAAATS
jgi:DNA polymerase-3 subunit delta'